MIRSERQDGESRPRPILISGPTASGKSALALALAERLDAAVVNADALQVYREWRILTARPSADEEARALHLLYGHTPAADASYSTGRWLREAAPLIQDARANGRALVIVGGTGLYFKALTEGLAEIPPTPPKIRDALEARQNEIGADVFAEELKARDPASAARIDLSNPRRVLRASEILAATGRGFAHWIDQTPPPLLPLTQCVALKLEIPRPALRARIATRFEAMIRQGALDEVAAMATRESDSALSPAAPSLKALGYAPLKAHLAGEMRLLEAIAQGVTDTHQYAKRQATWARNQMTRWTSIEDPAAASVEALAEQATV